MEAIYKKDRVFKYPEVFKCGNGSEFESEMKKLPEKHNVEIRRITVKYTHTQTAFVKTFNKEKNCCLGPWMLRTFRILKGISHLG